MIFQQNEIAVIGGGMVGGALALGLAKQGFRVTVVERNMPPAFDPLGLPEIRISALSAASINLLRQLGVWDIVLSMRAHPYRRVEVWDWEIAHVTFDANELQLPYLGYMVENNVLKKALWKSLESYSNVTLYMPASLRSLHQHEEGYYFQLNDGHAFKVMLIVGADGANSQVQKMANIGIFSWKYHQCCMLITVQCENDPGDSTWQHFTPNGPRAFLPLFGCWALLVWYDEPERIQRLQRASISQLENEIVRYFPSRLGKVRALSSGVFPLKFRHAFQYIRKGLALVGDAAHTIHPLAGQGVNLGYRDVSTLLHVISAARTRGELWSSPIVLSRYQRRRMADNLIMQCAMDIFYAGFGNNFWPMCFLRNMGLLFLEQAGDLKRQIMRYALGF